MIHFGVFHINIPSNSHIPTHSTRPYFVRVCLDEWHAQIDKVHARGWTLKEGVEFSGNGKSKITKQRFVYTLYTHKKGEEEAEKEDIKWKNEKYVHPHKTNGKKFNKIQFKFRSKNMRFS